MMINRSAIKRQAKAYLKTGKPSPMTAGIVLMCIGFAMSLALTLVAVPAAISATETLQLYMEAMESGDPELAMAALGNLVPATSTFSTFLNILVSLVTTILTVGLVSFCMRLKNGEQPPMGALMDGFGKVGRIIWLSILMYLYVALWSLLFVIPGIIASYRYRFAYMNLMDNDNLTARQALRLSCIQTRGMKGQLFLLDLSFIGWALLAQITFGIMNFYVQPYLILCELGYFEEAKRRIGQPTASPFAGQPPRSDDPWDN